MSGPTYTHVGKEVLRDGKHFADAADLFSAIAITNALNAGAEHDRLRKAADDYLHAVTNRTAAMAAKNLRDALAILPARSEAA